MPRAAPPATADDGSSTAAAPEPSMTSVSTTTVTDPSSVNTESAGVEDAESSQGGKPTQLESGHDLTAEEEALLYSELRNWLLPLTFQTMPCSKARRRCAASKAASSACEIHSRRVPSLDQALVVQSVNLLSICCQSAVCCTPAAACRQQALDSLDSLHSSQACAALVVDSAWR